MALTLGMLGLLCAAVAGLIFSQRFRGRLRTRCGTLMAYLIAIATLATLVSAVSAAHWQQSNVLTLSGLLISALLTLAASESARNLRRLRIGIVIPSLSPFHRDLRRGIEDNLDRSQYITIDPYRSGDFPTEDLSNFGSCLNEAIERRCDYLIVCAPAVNLANSKEVRQACLQLVKKGGHIVFIESVPEAELLTELKFASALVTDSSAGSNLIASFVHNYLEQHAELSSRPILVLPGPQHSRPAKARSEALSRELNRSVLDVRYSLTWTAAEAEELATQALRSLGQVAGICCGNDDMALGASRAVAKLGVKVPFITGHDGLVRAIVSIADPFTPLKATVRIPPRTFGERALLCLDQLSPRWKVLLPRGFHYCSSEFTSPIELELSRANLITSFSADRIID